MLTSFGIVTPYGDTTLGQLLLSLPVFTVHQDGFVALKQDLFHWNYSRYQFVAEFENALEKLIPHLTDRQINRQSVGFFFLSILTKIFIMHHLMLHRYILKN